MSGDDPRVFLIFLPFLLVAPIGLWMFFRNYGGRSMGDRRRREQGDADDRDSKGTL